jgi:hypothetical protein
VRSHLDRTVETTGDAVVDDQQSVLLDLIQFGLDLAGILDPTGIADGTSGAISAYRGQWMDAGISAASLLPYVGDLTKTAKLPKYIASVQKAVRIATKDAKFALELRPVLTKLRATLDQVPTHSLPAWAQSQLRAMRGEIDEFLGRRFYNPNPKHELPTAPGRRGTKLDLSSDEAYQLLNDPKRCIEVPDKKQFVAVNDGKLYVFQPDNTGAFHAYPSTGNEVYTKYPSIASEVARQLGIDVKRLSRLAE